jgi:putative heme-binding domain-containing protein
MRNAMLLLAVLPVTAALAQAPVKNPREGDPAAIQGGKLRFELSCAECHGIDAKGVFGPDLTTIWSTGLTDDRIFQTVRRGVQGSSMPASRLPDDEVWSILAYVKTLAPNIPPPTRGGNAENGERIFSTKCAACHQVNGRGGYVGPDLSRIGSSRSPEILIRDIRNASATIVPGYRPVTLVTSDGKRVRGVVKNEDAFSIQVMDMQNRLQGYSKSALKDVIAEKKSVMPDFAPAQLSDQDLNDLVRYLGTLRGAAPRS